MQVGETLYIRSYKSKKINIYIRSIGDDLRDLHPFEKEMTETCGKEIMQNFMMET
nr:MAG TPA: hypothetical protein [Caudoviricetes sp.]DAR09986.1 MAG TPA: hypothetical protein [Bacteriophage sp.]